MAVAITVTGRPLCWPEFRIPEGGAEDRGQGVVLALGVAASCRFGGLWGGFSAGDRTGRRGCTCRGAANFARIAPIIAHISGVATNFRYFHPIGAGG